MTRLMVCGPGVVLLCGAVWTAFGLRDQITGMRMAMEGIAAVGVGLGFHGVKKAVGANDDIIPKS